MLAAEPEDSKLLSIVILGTLGVGISWIEGNGAACVRWLERSLVSVVTDRDDGVGGSATDLAVAGWNREGAFGSMRSNKLLPKFGVLVGAGVRSIAGLRGVCSGVVILASSDCTDSRAMFAEGVEGVGANPENKSFGFGVGATLFVD